MLTKIGIIGLGYVGLPLAVGFCEAGCEIIGFDVDQRKIDALNKSQSYISYIKPESLEKLVLSKKFIATSNYDLLRQVEAVIICVPTPLTDYQSPDLRYVEATVKKICKRMEPGQLIVLESTTYPGTTEELVLPLLCKSGLKVGEDFYLAYSPERVDPNNSSFSLSDIPKVISGITPQCLLKAQALYSVLFKHLIPVSSTQVAEASKLLENIYRSVNIALVNELKKLFYLMEIDLFETIEAASTKPFGFKPFYPGPGLGGHCIPIDPFYLTWKAKEYDFPTKFIELAGEINSSMPYWVVQRVINVLNAREKSIKNAKVLVLGAAYKKDIDDNRESPSVKIIHLLKEKEAQVSYNDPHIPVLKNMRRFPGFYMKSTELSEEVLKESDCVLIVTDHSIYDYGFIYEHSSLIVDTRNAMKNYNDQKICRA